MEKMAIAVSAATVVSIGALSGALPFVLVPYVQNSGVYNQAMSCLEKDPYEAYQLFKSISFKD